MLVVIAEACSGVIVVVSPARAVVDVVPSVSNVGILVISLYSTWDEPDITPLGNSTWADPLKTPSASNLDFTAASVYPTLLVFVEIELACSDVIVVVSPANAVVEVVPIFSNVGKFCKPV